MKQSQAGVIWWDFDGTLVLRPAMWFEVLHEQLGTIIPGDEIDAVALDAQMNAGFPWHGNGVHVHLNDPEDWWAAVYARMEEALGDLGLANTLTPVHYAAIRASILDGRRYCLYPDVVPVLELLSRKGWRHMLVSNHVPELRKILADLSIDGYFSYVITSGEVGYEKPNGEIYQLAKDLSGATEKIWMIGDNLVNDCLAPQRFGVNSILVRNLAGRHEFVSQDLLGVVDLVC